jgi:hypothetical protein
MASDFTLNSFRFSLDPLALFSRTSVGRFSEALLIAARCGLSGRCQEEPGKQWPVPTA